MSYTILKTLNLGGANTGLTLSALLLDPSGEEVGETISSGFVELPNGQYLWSGTVENDFAGFVKFFNSESESVYGIVPIDANFTELMAGLDDALEQLEILSGQAASLASFEIIIRIMSGVAGVPNIPVTIKTTLGGNPATQRTDLDGYAYFALPAGNYKVFILSGNLYDPLPAQDLEITADTSVSYTLQNMVIPSTAPPGKVTVYGSLGLPSVTIGFDIEGRTPIVAGDVFIPDIEYKAKTNSSGQFTINLYPSSSMRSLTGESNLQYKVNCAELNIVDRLIRIPDEGPVNIVTLIT
jgi:hypothetical protein